MSVISDIEKNAKCLAKELERKFGKVDNMTEWLTTGQMVDRLKVGEIAEGNSYWEVKHVELGKIIELNTGANIVLEPSFMKEHWRILPNYVSFDEAKTALEEGKKVKFQTPNGHWLEIENDTRIKGFSFDDFFSANWIIEDD